MEVGTNLARYILSSDARFRERAESALANAQEELNILEDILRSEPGQNYSVQLLQSQLNEYVTTAGKVIQHVAAGESLQALAILNGGDYDSIVTAIRADAEALVQLQGNLEAARRSTLVTGFEKGMKIVGIGAATLIVLTLFIGYVFSRAMRLRFRSLMDSVKKFATGVQHTPTLHGQDEIALLERAFYELSKSLASRSYENEAFIYSVSHDMRSPLLNLHGFTKELRTALGEIRDTVQSLEMSEEKKNLMLSRFDRDIPKSLRYITAAVDRLSTIIDALLKLSRAGRVHYHWQMVEVETVVQRVVEALQNSITEKQAIVTAQKLPPVYGDPNAIEQIFANLIGNAVKYLDPARPGQIEVSVIWDQSTPEEFTFAVRDNGRGFSERFLPKVFLPFQRHHSSITSGEGMGLALVYRMVERHHGTIWAESKEGEGTVFYLKLLSGAPAQPLTNEGDAQVELLATPK